jgi:hypothetical protein
MTPYTCIFPLAIFLVTAFTAAAQPSGNLSLSAIPHNLYGENKPVKGTD